MKNNYILEAIDNIELATVFSEMEVCLAIAANCEKQATILEYATVPSDFEFYMEALSEKEKASAVDADFTELNEDGSNKTSLATTSNSTSAKATGKESNGTTSDSKELAPKSEVTAPATKEEQVKAVWIKKFVVYVRKIFSTGVRLLGKIIGKAVKSFDKVFDTEENRNKVPVEVLETAKGLVGLVLFDYKLLATSVIGITDEPVFKWTNNAVKVLQIPDIMKKGPDIIQNIKNAEKNTPVIERTVDKKSGELLGIVAAAYKKMFEPQTHIKELNEIVWEFGTSLSKFTYDIDIEALNSAKENKLSRSQMDKFAAISNTIQHLISTHERVAMNFLLNICELVKEGKQVTIPAAMEGIRIDTTALAKA